MGSFSRYVRANVLLTALCAIAHPALADEAGAPGAPGIAVASRGLILAPRAAGLALVDEDAGFSAVSVGRDQDIIGIPINDLRGRTRSGALVGGAAALRFPGLPSFAAMPSRLPLSAGSMTSRFGARRHPIFGGFRAHSGVDLAAPTGSPIYAPSDGYVSAAQWNGGYGLFVALEHGGGMQTRYGHMSQISVASGQYVKAGSVIGYVGSTGNSTGPHLHYEVRMNGQAINPVGR
jgi:murein DD-endopeptidase MepM/ murein hydrolase activator NlpD